MLKPKLHEEGISGFPRLPATAYPLSPDCGLLSPAFWLPSLSSIFRSSIFHSIPLNYPATKAYLLGLKSTGAKFGIDHMRVLAARLGHPERAYPVIHVAGTNGKGSVCAMIEAMHRRMGRTVGMYTSPHLVFLGERVQVNRQPLSPDELCHYVELVRPHAEAMAKDDPINIPSYFEFMTAAAFVRFKEKKVDVALIEVGLGGRLDATNVVQPQLCVITSIGFDHMDYLGDTLEKIAIEKAGIIKPGVPVVIGQLSPEAEAPIRAIAKERGAPVHSVREVFGENVEDYPRTRLAGSFQRVNAATAILATRVIEKTLPVSDAARTSALAEVDWPARWQKFALSNNRTLILDASHNLEGAQTLDENLACLRKETGRAPIIIVGALGEHRAKALLDVAARHAREIILLQPNQPRATEFAVLEKLVPANFSGVVKRGQAAEIFSGPGECALGNSGDTIVATGSIYLLGEILERFAHPTLAGEGTLQDTV